jgi:Protein of unknown function (DUF3302)
MRSVARNPRDGEISGLAAYYASVPAATARRTEEIAMLGFKLDFWDYATFAVAALAGAAGVLTYIWLAGLPGRIALARKHPEADAVKIMGWAGLLPTVLPWIQAFIWAFRPTEIVDIRRFPKEEASTFDADAGHLKDKADLHHPAPPPAKG